MEVRDTIPAIPPASRAFHISSEDGGSGGGARSEPKEVCNKHKDVESLESAQQVRSNVFMFFTT